MLLFSAINSSNLESGIFAACNTFSIKIIKKQQKQNKEWTICCYQGMWCSLSSEACYFMWIWFNFVWNINCFTFVTDRIRDKLNFCLSGETAGFISEFSLTYNSYLTKAITYIHLTKISANIIANNLAQDLNSGHWFHLHLLLPLG